MDFNAKNFRYTTMTFGNFTEQVGKGKRLYLRALSADAPTDQPANLEQDFPMLSPDFALPDGLSICGDNIHSSILRISGPVQMWLHFGETPPHEDRHIAIRCAFARWLQTRDTAVPLLVSIPLLVLLLMLSFRCTSQRLLSDPRL